jgi:hypothetical protein
MAAPPNDAPRALRPKRFGIELPVEFRTHDSNRWWQGTTVDISANGILFRSLQRVPPKMPVDVRFQLPPALTGERAVPLLCSGYIVRSVEAQSPRDGTRIAATFLSCKLANGGPGPPAGLPPPSQQQSREDVARLVLRLKRLLVAIQNMSELVAREPGNQAKIRRMALQAQHAAKETVPVVQSLARAVDQGPAPDTDRAQPQLHRQGSRGSHVRQRRYNAAQRSMLWTMELIHKKPKDTGGLTSQFYCPSCSGTDVRPSRHRAHDHFVMLLLPDIRPYRCNACWSRFYGSERDFPDLPD